MYSAFPPFKVLKALYSKEPPSFTHNVHRHWGLDHSHSMQIQNLGFELAYLPVIKQPALPTEPLPPQFTFYFTTLLIVVKT